MRKLMLVLVGLFLATAAHAAIEKDITHESGLTGNYIYLTAARLKFSNEPTACSTYTFSVWASKAQFDAGKQPLIRDHKTVVYCGEDDPLNSTSINAAGAAVTDGNYYAGIYGSIYAKAVEAVPAVHTITAVADVAGSLGGKAIEFYTPDEQQYHVWFNVDNANIQPGIGGTAYEVAIAADSSADVVASGIRGAIAAAGITVSGTGADVILTQNNPGIVAPPNDFGSLGFTITTTVEPKMGIIDYVGGTLVP